MLFSKSDMSHAHPQNILARFDLIIDILTSQRPRITDVQHYFVRERVVRNDVMSLYRTTDMVTDCMTKALAHGKLEHCVKAMSMQ